MPQQKEAEIAETSLDAGRFLQGIYPPGKLMPPVCSRQNYDWNLIRTIRQRCRSPFRSQKSCTSDILCRPAGTPSCLYKTSYRHHAAGTYHVHGSQPSRPGVIPCNCYNRMQVSVHPMNVVLRYTNPGAPLSYLII